MKYLSPLPRTAGNLQLTMGYLPQYNSIDRKFPITVEEVILSGLSSKKSLISRFTKEHEKAHQVIVRMGLEGLEERAIGALSGGQASTRLAGTRHFRSRSGNPRQTQVPISINGLEARLYQLLAEIKQGAPSYSSATT